MHATGNIFKREGFNMKNTETAFYSFKQFKIFIASVEVFRLFSIYLKDIAAKYLKNQNFFWKFQVTFHVYLDIGRDNNEDYDDGKSNDKDLYE